MSTDSLTITPPSLSLRPYIRHYVIIPPGEPAGGGVFLPYSGAILSFFNEAQVLVNGKSDAVIQTTNPTLFGPVAEPFVYARGMPKQTRDISVVFTALGSALLCGPVMDQLESEAAELDCFAGNKEIRPLLERLFEASSVAMIVALLNRYFHRKFTGLEEETEGIAPQAIGLLEAPKVHGFVHGYNVDALKAHLHFSSRHLQRVMLRSTGLTPKRYLSVLRINHVVEYLRKAPKAPYSEIAAHFGYTDQAHFLRDFERNTLTKPATYFGSPSHQEHRSFMDVE